ncbi:MAG: hypothetical protein QNJ53_17965 [Pleurocapsa sp. MO_192.B19]|nr:hypothetical protein [Pleurocapsa sp. MO_192.B19]
MTHTKKTWRKVVYKTGVWLAAEIWLNIIGLDNIADYSEFIFGQNLNLNKKNRRTVKITEYPPQFCPKIDDFCPIPGTVNKPKDLEKESCNSKAETFKNKCQQLTMPCLKIVCLETKIEEE